MPAREVLAAITRELARREGLTGTQLALLDAEGVDGLPPVPDGATVDLLGLAHEALLVPVDRKARGAHYTPPALADRLVALTLDGLDGDPATWRILDPACGGAAFLLAAGRALVARGIAPAAAARLLHGIDLDPLAAAVARATIALWSGGTPAAVTVGDALVADPGEAFDAVVGNPPFQSPLHLTTARSTAAAEAWRSTLGDAGGPYADVAGLFLLRALDLVRPGGRIGLIQPQSVLTSRDAEGVRAAVQERAALRALWVAEQRMFAASTHVVAVVAERGGTDRPVKLYAGPAVEPRATSDRDPPSGHSTSWGALAARARGLPEVGLGGGPTVASRATAAAGFRQQFYGLLEHLTEDGSGSPVVTAGLIDPLHCAWGERPARIGGRTWTRPTVEVDALEPGLRAWFAARQVPKLLVASQTKVVEVVVDEAGTLLPSVPVIAIEAPADRLWELAAALSAPPITAWALERALGSGLSADAVRLSARLLLEVPLPSEGPAWGDATAALRTAAAQEDARDRRAALAEYGRIACRAYAVDEDLAVWWADRLP